MNLDTRRDVRDNFIDKREPLNVDIPMESIYGMVYCIENLRNHKKFIGSSTDFERRAAQFLRDYASLSNNMEICKNICNDGIEDYIMYPIWNCADSEEMRIKEMDFINKFKTIDYKYGYNDQYVIYNHLDCSDKTRAKMSDAHKGLKATAETRKKKSRPAVCINIDERKIYFTDSLALFGEVVIHKSRDMVSHGARDRRKVAGYFLIYRTEKYCAQQVQDMKEFYSRPIRPCNGRIKGRSEEYAQLSECIISGDYSVLVNNDFQFFVLEYVDNEAGYTLKEIIYDKPSLQDN